MPRKNIFKAKRLTLDYLSKEDVKPEEDYNYFILKKEDEDFGGKYDTRGARNLIITIQQEIQRSEHEMTYNLKRFNITPKAIKQLEKLQKNLGTKSLNQPHN